VSSGRLRIGVDFGLTTTDALAWSDADAAGQPPTHRASLLHAGPASEGLLDRLVAELGLRSDNLASIAVTGGRSRSLPESWRGVPLIKVPEPEAIGRGGLSLASEARALVVSCGTGTAMVLADAPAGIYRHVSGTAVGGGTLIGLAHALLDERDTTRLAELAADGDASGVDTTLGEVLGGGVGNLPPEATAVNFGRLAHLANPPAASDVAAGLMTMVAQVIALIAINSARAHHLERVVAIGRLPQWPLVRRTFDAVADLYGAAHFAIPARGGEATALGAVLAADAQPR
jgi:type II pantothenate kinase